MDDEMRMRRAAQSNSLVAGLLDALAFEHGCAAFRIDRFAIVFEGARAGTVETFGVLGLGADGEDLGWMDAIDLLLDGARQLILCRDTQDHD